MGSKPEGAGPELPAFKQADSDSDMTPKIDKPAVATRSDVRTSNRQIILIAVLTTVAIVAITLGVTLGNGGSSSNSNVENDVDSSSDDGASNSILFRPGVGPFDDIVIPVKGSGEIEVYPDEESARDGFSTFAKFLLNNLVLRNTGAPGFGGAVSGGVTNDVADSPPDFEAGLDAPGQGREQNDPTDEVNGFETNNQEAGVDQADISKSDGSYIFSGFRDRLLVIDAQTGLDIVDLTMPSVDQYTPQNARGAAPGQEKSKQGDQEEEEELQQGTSRSSVYYNAKPYIESLLLGTNRLCVVMSGYGQTTWYDGRGGSILSSSLSTHFRLYDTSDLGNGNLRLVGVQDVNGYFMSGYVIDDIVHIATSSSLNTYDWLIAPNERWQEQFSSLTDEEYEQAVKSNALNESIGRFVDQLIYEVSASTESFPKVTSLRLPIDHLSGVTGFENMLFSDGYVNSMVQISSFDMGDVRIMNPNEGSGALGKLELDVSIQFLPTYWAQAYSATTMLIIAGQGQSFDTDRQAAVESTHLFGYSLDGVSTKPRLTGWVPGSMLNEYSIDYHDGYVRIATTVNRWRFVDTFIAVEPAGGRRLQPSMCPPVEDECNNEDNAEICFELERRGCNEIFVGESCPLKFVCSDPVSSNCPGIDDCNDEQNAKICYDLEKNGCTNIFVMESCPLQFGCGDATNPPTSAPMEQSESLTENRIYVLKADEGDTRLEVTGSVRLGKKDETFTSLRFFETVAYAVTYLRRDPFYVIDFSVPSTPTILGELDISGFSSYLHSLNDENTIILGVGRESDDSGVDLGLQISLFDTSNQMEPKLLDRFLVNEGQESWSSSAAEWDEKAFRYLAIDETEGRLVLPVSYSLDDGSYFDGFTVFTITTNKISYSFDISHREGNYNNINSRSCYYCGGRLADRSFVINGDVITLQGHSVRSHDLGDGAFNWMLDLNPNDDQCCGW